MSQNKIQDKYSVVIKEFASALNPSDYWRIDWLGNIRRHGPHLAQHQVDVFFSPLNRHFQGVLTAPGAADPFHQHLVPIGVGCLPMLHIGAVFKEGHLVPQPPRKANRQRFFVSLDQQRPFSLSNPIDRFLPYANRLKAITPNEFVIGGRAWKQAVDSQLTAIPDKAGSDSFFLMIPNLEIARFFFCTSSVLARNLFSNAWEKLIWNGGCNTENRPHEITVGLNPVAGVRYRDARTLGLKLASPAANECIRSIYQSLQSASRVNNTPLSCFFPAQGDVQIEAEVIEIQTGTKLGKRFFVTRLISCEWNLPFQICYANPLIHPGQGENWDEDDLISTHIPKPGNTSPPPTGDPGGPYLEKPEELMKKGEITDELGRPMQLDDDIEVDAAENRFPKLNEVPTPLLHKLTQKYKNDPDKEKGKKFPVDAATTSTAEPGGASNPVAPTNIDTNPPKPPPMFDPATLVKLLADTASFLIEKGYGVEKLPPQALANAKHVASPGRSWLKIKVGFDPETQVRRFRSRYLVGLLVNYKGKQCILADIERRGAESYSLFGYLVPPDHDASDCFQLIGAAVIRRSGWPTFRNAENISDVSENWTPRSARTIHMKGDTAEQLAARIKTSILDVLMPRNESE